MSKEHGYTARWHLLHGSAVPAGPPRDYLLRLLEPELGPAPVEVAGPLDETPADDPEAPAPDSPVVPSPSGTTPLPPVAALPTGYRDVPHVTANMGGAMRPQGVVFHSTYGAAAGSLSWIKNPTSRVSYHTLIFPDGTRHHVVPLNRVAWHAGASSFRGRSGCNGFMAGVAFEGDLYRRDLTADELASAVEFVGREAPRWGWTLPWITDHRTVSPGRKVDIPPAVLEQLRDALAPVLPRG
jgi:AmpD protein